MGKRNPAVQARLNILPDIHLYIELVQNEINLIACMHLGNEYFIFFSVDGGRQNNASECI